MSPTDTRPIPLTCDVCRGGWNRYWSLIMSGLYAKVCDEHIAESRATIEPKEQADG
jgi:hypothetical protein